MWSFICKLGSPKTAYNIARSIQPWAGTLCFIAFAYGLLAGLLLAPADYQQGNVYRIIYLHAPAAIMSLSIYTVMSVAAAFYLIWKIKLADVIAKASAPIGALLTVMTLITGAIWGKPTWGTWWIWDARLTSELILLFIYGGVMAMRAAMPEAQLGAKASAVVTLVGLVNIPIIHYSVNWWHTLHQGATVLQFARPTIAASMLHPLLAMLAAFMLYYVWLLCYKVRVELLQREQHSTWVKAILAR